jgi:hypothetical protein
MRILRLHNQELTMQSMLGINDPAMLSRLEEPFQDFTEKLNDPYGISWEETFKKYLRKELAWPCPFCNPFRETGELIIEMPALKRPTLAELQAERSDIKDIIRDTSPEGPVTLKLGTVLRPEETKSINGPEYQRRIAALRNAGRVLGWQHRKWLREHQDEHPELKTLLGKIYIDFPGLEVLGGDGRRGFPCAVGRGKRWRDGWGWMDGDFRSLGRIAVSASSNSPVPAP